jgi:hypothetical protein
MILGICSHDEHVCDIINTQDSQSPIDYYFFQFTITQQQKLIDRLNKDHKDVETTTTIKTIYALCKSNSRISKKSCFTVVFVVL